MRWWRGWIVLLLILAVSLVPAPVRGAEKGPPIAGPVSVYVLPIHWDIMPSLLKLVERGIEEANTAKADVLILDLHTDGGRVDVVEKVLKLLEGFRPDKKDALTVAFVNKNALEAGALIALGTKRIYMAPGSLIGGVEPRLMSPGGAAIHGVEGSMEEKMNVFVRGLARASASRNRHNEAVVEAMINADHPSLEIAGEVISPQGELLTMTAHEAERLTGDPPVTLLSQGTKEKLEDVLAALGVYDAMDGRRPDLEDSGLNPAVVVRLEPTDYEIAGIWFATISPLLMIAGIVGLLIEFKTPGFGIPGMIGVGAFLLFFVGGYMAELTSKEWMIGCFLLFLAGLLMVVLEFYVFPGTVALGAIGGIMALAALLFAQLDLSERNWHMPAMPEVTGALLKMFIAVIGAALVLWVLARMLPRTDAYNRFAGIAESGVASTEALLAEQEERVGQLGVTKSPLQPGGKAMFEGELLDVISEGEPVEAGQPVRIIGHSGNAAVVELAGD